MHRFVWDLHGPPLATSQHEYPIAAVYRDTPREPRGPWVLPGTYTVRLTAGGTSFTQPLTVRMDPRVRTTAAGLAQQYAIAAGLAAALRRDSTALAEVVAARGRLRAAKARAGAGASPAAIDSLDAALAAAERRGERGDRDALALYGVIEGSDLAPTTQAVAAAGRLAESLAAWQAEWRRLAPQVERVAKP